MRAGRDKSPSTILAVRRIEFGYNPPTGTRQIEVFEPRTFVRDLQSVLDVASQAFSSLWFSDHLMTVEPFRMECWTEMTWAAARFPGPMLGTIVMANSYRPPALMAKMAASLQAFSHGRLILGYGAGWHETEYRAYGYPFPKASQAHCRDGRRHPGHARHVVGRPGELQRALLRDRRRVLRAAPEVPIPIMIGGDGEQLTLKAVAEHGDWWNALMRPRDVLKHKIAVLEEHCRNAGRDPGEIRRTLTRTVYLKKSKAEAEAWAGNKLQNENPPFAGEPSELVDHLHELSELGFDLFQMVFAGFPDTSDMRLFIDEVLPRF